MPTSLLNPTKQSLIQWLTDLPCADDARLNVSIDDLDIYTVTQADFDPHPDPSQNEFCINFAS